MRHVEIEENNSISFFYDSKSKLLKKKTNWDYRNRSRNEDDENMEVFEALLAVLELAALGLLFVTALPGASMEDVESRALGSTELIRLPPRKLLVACCCCCCCCGGNGCCFPPPVARGMFEVEVPVPVELPMTDDARCEMAVSAAAAMFALACALDAIVFTFVRVVK
jgi:hypothetical protein